MQVQKLFAEVVGLDTERRSARLDRVEDPRLRNEVERLLDRHVRGEPISPDAPPGTVESREDGEVVGHYRLMSELGRGAMGVVYRAEDTRLGRPVALKFLTPQLSADKRARARLEREARAASALDHPNICTVYEIGETDDGRLYLALACYDGETLEHRIAREPLSVDEAVRIGVHIARGLAAAHRHGIVHRDVKPSNVLVTDDRAVKLLDFGIARVADSNLTDSGDTLGTVAYMSPEQLRGEVDARADVWALGVVLYEMLTGERPFQGDYEAALLYGILHKPPTPITRDDVPDELAEIVRRCLDKEPDVRYQSAEEVEVALERLGLREASQPVRRRVARRRWSLVAFLGAALLALAVLASPLRTQIAEGLGFGRPGMQHLAVLPLMASADEASMGEGLTLTLTSLLTRIGADAEEPIRVVPASEMREIETAAEAHKEFGVGVVVSGNFQQDRDEVHLTLNLIDARTLHQIDSETLSEPVSRLPILQQRATVALANMLGISLSEERKAMLTNGSTADPEAYEFYLEGRAALDRYDRPENVDRAIQMFDWALEEDSLFALAHAGLGEAYLRKYQATSDTNWVSATEMHSNHALRLADRLAPVRLTLGMLYMLTGETEAALSEYGVALTIDSSNADAHHGLAVALRKSQRFEEAEVNYKKAISLQPYGWKARNDYATFLMGTDRAEEAVQQMEKAADVVPSNAVVQRTLAAAYYFVGDLDQAADAYRRSNELSPSYSAYSNLATILKDTGHFEEAIHAYLQALEMNDRDSRVWFGLAQAYSDIEGKESEVQRAFQQTLDRVEMQLTVDSKSAEFLHIRAYALFVLGDAWRAKNVLDEIERGAVGSVTTILDIAALYGMMGERDEANYWLGEASTNGVDAEMLEEDGRFGWLKSPGLPPRSKTK